VDAFRAEAVRLCTLNRTFEVLKVARADGFKAPSGALNRTFEVLKVCRSRYVTSPQSSLNRTFEVLKGDAPESKGDAPEGRSESHL